MKRPMGWPEPPAESDAVVQSELIRRCVALSAEADALLELMAAGQEQLAKLEHRVLRLEMRLASCR